jgi:hypothetical protein
MTDDSHDQSVATRVRRRRHGFACFIIIVTVWLGFMIAGGFSAFHYTDIIGAIGTSTELMILYFIVLEFPLLVEQLGEIRKKTVTTVGSTQELFIGANVHVLKPEIGKPREEWADDNSVWRIISVNPKTNTAIAVPVASIGYTQVPTVEGPTTGPNSPFIRM